MAITNHERVGKALDLLKKGLGPFVEREFKNIFKERAATESGRFMGEDRLNTKKPVAEWDVAVLLKVMRESPSSLKPWREVVMPHEDVASGRYQQAEFAADLWQVASG